VKIRFAVSPGSEPLDAARIASLADALEASAFDGVWLSDLPLANALEPLLGLALIAGRTDRLKLGANVVPLGRNPFLLAKELAQLDQISDGRLLLSFVPGIDAPGEREALGTAGADRGALLEQSIALLRGWWAGETIDHAGAALAPAARPLQDPLEIWLGGRGPKALARVGRIADGWLGAAVTPDEALDARRRIEESAAGAGREVDPEHYGMSIPYARLEPPPSVLAGYRARRPDADPRATVAVGAAGLRSLVEGYIEAGLSKFVVRPVGAVGDWEDELDWLAGAILALQS
jgi:probable F420-dependent oxidoreductase